LNPRKKKKAKKGRKAGTGEKKEKRGQKRGKKNPNDAGGGGGSAQGGDWKGTARRGARKTGRPRRYGSERGGGSKHELDTKG